VDDAVDGDRAALGEDLAPSAQWVHEELIEDDVAFVTFQ
jgi:hypothetical protein